MPKIIDFRFDVTDTGQPYLGCSLTIKTDEDITYNVGGYCFNIYDSRNTYQKLLDYLLTRYPERKDLTHATD